MLNNFPSCSPSVVNPTLWGQNIPTKMAISEIIVGPFLTAYKSYRMIFFENVK